MCCDLFLSYADKRRAHRDQMLELLFSDSGDIKMHKTIKTSILKNLIPKQYGYIYMGIMIITVWV